MLEYATPKRFDETARRRRLLYLSKLAVAAGVVAAVIGLFYVVKAAEPKRPPSPQIVGPAFPEINLGMIVLGLALFATEALAGLIAICLGAISFAKADRRDRDGIATRGALAIGLALFGWCVFAWMVVSK